ncbi:MAG: hypothetical protein P8180_11940 [Gammaproteobacteria bacterium]
MQKYLAQPQYLIVYYPPRPQLDDQLKVLGMTSIGERLVQQFHRIRSTRGLIERFVSHVPRLAKGPTRIVDSRQWSTLDAPSDTPVLFFSASWKMHYQRLPPKLNNYRLQLGVIVKVIPLGQVLSGKGGVALRTSAWEGRCLFDAFGGRYFSVDDWLARDAMRLRQGVVEAQSSCATKLANEFPSVAGMSRKH